MLPPLLLGVEAEHAVFDMCAAPGSKTAQIFELMMCSQVFERDQENTKQTKGFIVANDADAKRAFLLTH
jgi:16S rRNA C967 or C1407 C5-methylase (RsmB/RsmF family)